MRTKLAITTGTTGRKITPKFLAPFEEEVDEAAAAGGCLESAFGTFFEVRPLRLPLAEDLSKVDVECCFGGAEVGTSGRFLLVGVEVSVVALDGKDKRGLGPFLIGEGIPVAESDVENGEQG